MLLYACTVDAAKFSQLLLAALKADETPSSYGFAFKAAAQLGGDVAKFFAQIEDVIQQADEIDDKYLQVKNLVVKPRWLSRSYLLE